MREDKLVAREVSIGTNKITVDLNNPVYRYLKNPILTSHSINKVWTDPALQVKTVHNAGVTEFNGKILMLFRSHLRGGISILGKATSKNGFSNWQIDPKPAMIPAHKDDKFAKGTNKNSLIENEAGGIEDARITKLDGIYLITYSAYHGTIKDRVRVSIATTKDFETFTRHGPVLNRDMRNVVFFPEKINGKYIGLFRPNDEDTSQGHIGGIFKQIIIGFSDDWITHEWNFLKKPIIQVEGGPSAVMDKIGPGAQIIKTRKGWLNIFHGVRTTMDGNPYVLSVALHDLKDPTNVKVSNIPILFPSEADCNVEESDYVHVPNVVFTCGAIRREDGSILIYYGGNDTVMNIAITHEDVLIALCEKFGQDPRTGKPLFVPGKPIFN